MKCSSTIPALYHVAPASVDLKTPRPLPCSPSRHINNICIGRCDGNGADGRDVHCVKDRLPRTAGVIGLPNAAIWRPRVIRLGCPGNPDDSGNASARCVPRKRQRSPEYASGLMSARRRPSPIAKIRQEKNCGLRFPIEKDLEDVLGTDEITNFSRGNSLLRLSRRRCSLTCNQTRSAAEGHELNSPLDKNHHPL